MTWVDLQNDLVRLRIGTDPAGDAWLQSFLPSGLPAVEWQPAVRLPLAELATVDSGRLGLSTGLRQVDGSPSHRLRLESHELDRDGTRQKLVLHLRDPETELAVDQVLTLHDDESTVA